MPCRIRGSRPPARRISHSRPVSIAAVVWKLSSSVSPRWRRTVTVPRGWMASSGASISIVWLGSRFRPSRAKAHRGGPRQSEKSRGRGTTAATRGLLARNTSWCRDAVDENVGEEARFDQSRFHQRRVNEVAVAPNASADPFLRRPLRCPCPRWRILLPLIILFTIIGVYCSGNNVFDVYVIAKLNAAFRCAGNQAHIDDEPARRPEQEGVTIGRAPTAVLRCSADVTVHP
ncbi:hypothetical protein SAMN05216573_10253 [Bradyrhizobium sp. Rc3b]|nr:hypothetical protein SAMN05216573_10253 [Bradyrhizobium sp. Rc3b]